MSGHSVYHRPVLCREMVHWLAPQPNGVYIDVTFGGGGHTEAILRAEPTCTVIAFDWDEQALRMNGERLLLEFPQRLQLVWANFAHIRQQLKRRNIQHVDGLIADFGTSQYQLKERAGFSFMNEDFLDMRMSPAHGKLTAYEIVNHAAEQELARILWDYGEERLARDITHAIIRARPIETARKLAEIIASAVSSSRRELGMERTSSTHPATRTFQALRMIVNRELENIRSLLSVVPQIVRSGGRFLCMTFHSIEDRLVKQMVSDQRDLWLPLSKHVIVPTDEEIHTNPSARSVKLRALQRR